MSSDTILTDPDGGRWSLDNAITQGWLDGHECGVEVVTTWLVEQAAALFAKDRDKEASELKNLAREIAKQLIPKMKERAERHKAEFPYRLPDGEIANGDLSTKYIHALYDRRIDECEFSVRTEHVLNNGNIFHLGQLVQYTAAGLKKLKNCGKRTVREIEELLAEVDPDHLRLGMVADASNPMIVSWKPPKGSRR